MSIMQKLFGPKQESAPPQTNNLQNNPAPTSQPQQTEQTAPNRVVPAQEPPSPLDKFNDLWKPPTEGEAPEPFGLNLDPAKLLEAANKADFSKFISKEELAKIEAGGPQATEALANILNTSLKAVYGQSSVATAKIVEAAVDRAREQFIKNLPSFIKQEQAHSSLLRENPAFNSPAVSPIIDSLKSQLAAKYPKATSDELTQMAKDYLTGVAQTISPPAKPVKSEVPKAEDWSDFLV